MGLAHFLYDYALVRGWREGRYLFGRPCLDAVARRGNGGFGGRRRSAFPASRGWGTGDDLGPWRPGNRCRLHADGVGTLAALAQAEPRANWCAGRGEAPKPDVEGEVSIVYIYTYVRVTPFVKAQPQPLLLRCALFLPSAT